MLRTLFTIAGLAAALALPAAAPAMTGPAGGDSTAVSPPANLLRDGKYAPRPAPTPAPTLEVVRLVKPGGFDFAAAGIGAALGAAVLAVVGGLLIVLHRE